MRSLGSFVLVLIAISIAQTTTLAQSASFSRTDFPSLGNNHAIADVNGDAIPDLIGTGTSAVGVMLGTGNGSFRARVDFETAGAPQDVTTGDFNGDGRVDLAVSMNDPATMLSLLTGNGDGTFNLTLTVANTARTDSPAIVATDLDNDGRLDLVLAHVIGCFTAPCIASQDITVLLGLGDGTFQQPFEIAVGTGMSRIAVGDFNRDGIKDLAIAGDNSRVYTLLGIGNGSFLKQPDITLTADTLFVDGTDVDVADLNRDSIDDLVVAIPLNGSRTAVLLGRGDGTFGAPSILTEPDLLVPQYQVVADFNRDGLLDIAFALANGSLGLMEIRNGNGDGTFRSPVRYFRPPSQSSIGGGTLAGGDFNRDGRVDLALPIVGASPALAVALNSTGLTTVQPAYGSVTATPSTVVSGNTTEIRITLVSGSVAPSNGFTFSVSSSNSAALSVPSSVFMSQGTSTVAFKGTARSVNSSRNVTVRVSNDRLGRREVSVTVTPSTTQPPPPALTVSALSLSPSSVVGGNSVQGTVTLSASAPSATVVSLASSSAQATVPASVTIAAGASSGTFTVGTAAVTATTSATISASLNGVTRSATLTINPASAPPPPSTDTVNITRAEYDSDKRVLRVEATSTSSSATLQVFVSSTGQLIGTMSNSGGGQYRGEFGVSTNPQNITVRSSLGGVATRSVVAK